ncbi:MAG: HAD-IIIA family hydrolase [Zetaproteobacteria bacterium]|nr:HAD-IIIA family hydrolase [Zetaproteobacteria bacterium]
MNVETRIDAVLLDRDGVINFDSPDYILTPEQWQPVPESLQAIARLTAAAIPVAICSNQSALARGMMTMATFEQIHGKMMLMIEEMGGSIAHVAYCFHGPDEGCECRKPLPGLLIDSLAAIDVAPSERVWMIGDSLRDVKAAKAAGVSAMLVQTGYGDAAAIHQASMQLLPDIVLADDLSGAVAMLLEGKCY